MKFIDVTKDEELNKRLENVLVNFNYDDHDYDNKNDFDLMNTYKNNNKSKQKL